MAGLSTRPDDIKRRAAAIADPSVCTDIGLWATEATRIAFGDTRYGEREDNQLVFSGTGITVAPSQKAFTPASYEQWMPCMLAYAACLTATHPALAPGVFTFIAMVNNWHIMGSRSTSQLLVLERIHRQRYALGDLAWGQLHMESMVLHVANAASSHSYAPAGNASATSAPASKVAKRSTARDRRAGTTTAVSTPPGGAATRGPCFDWNGVGGKSCSRGDACKWFHHCAQCNGAHALMSNAECYNKYGGKKPATFTTKGTK